MPAPRPFRIVQGHTRIGDPHVTSDDADRLSILHALFEPLVIRGEGGAFRPCLAARWTLSDDACTWTFYLCEGVVFHDGTACTSEDVAASLTRIRDGNVGGELGTTGVFAGYLAGSVIAVDGAYTVTLTTPAPAADLLDLLVDIPILPRHSIERLPDAFIGTGPYRLAAQTGGEVRLVRFDTYRMGGDRPELVVWQGIAEPQERLGRLLAGEADVATALPPSARQAVAAAPDLRFVPAQTGVCATFMCNLLRGPCTHRAFRQALNYALDVPALIREVTGGAGIPLTGPLTPHHFGFDPGAPGYRYDPSRARALFDETGTHALTLDVPATLPDEAVALAERMAVSYRDVGIETRIVVHHDRPAYAGRVKASAIHDAACFDSSPLSTFRVFREKFHSGVRGPWWLGYDNPRVNRLLDAACATIDTEKRQGLYRRAYRLVSEDAPWIFLYSPVRYHGGRRSTGAWQVAPGGTIRLVP